jgi:magnesium transporter
MEPDTQVEVLEDLEPARAADILEEMSPDDAADLVADLSDRSRDEILALMEADEAAEVRDLLSFPEDSAGGLMTTELVAMPEGMTAAQAIERLRELEPDAETIYYVYVVDSDNRLVGVLSLRDLIVAQPDTAISEVMIKEPVAVGVLEPAESVAETIAHYNLLAIPVVDNDGRLAGIVTVDDAIDTVAPSAWRRRLPRVFARGGREAGPAGEPMAAAGRGRDGAPRP